MRTLVIIPSYNEEENIVRLIRALRTLEQAPDVLVVDDGTDGTAELIAAEAAHDPHISLLKREGKGGRGSAVLDGIDHALTQNYDAIAEMDADFSHDPTVLPQLLAIVDPNTIVIGSRYRAGSKIKNWPIGRRIFSRLANQYARMVLRIPITDYTNGYRVYGRNAAAVINRSRITSNGYIVLSEIAMQCHQAGCTFREVPVTFVNRVRGMSNFSLQEIKESLTSVWNLRQRSR